MAIHDLGVRIGWGTAATNADGVIILPTLKVNDTFTDTGGTELGSHTPDTDTVGGGWGGWGAWYIHSGGTTAECTTATFSGRAVIDCGVEDHMVEADVTLQRGVGNLDWQGVGVRGYQQNTGPLIAMLPTGAEGTSSVTLGHAQVATWGFTDLSAGWTYSGTFDSGSTYTMRLAVKGNEFIGWVNGENVGSYTLTDATLIQLFGAGSGATHVGLAENRTVASPSPTARWDNFDAWKDGYSAILDEGILGLPYGTTHVPVDVTSFVQGAQWSRGRRNDLEEVRTGPVSLQVIDEAANFDPLNTASTYTSTLGAPIILTYDGVPLGEFHVSDFVARHQINVDAVLWAVSGLDRTAVLTAELDTIASSYSGDTTGARIDRVLDAAGVAWGGRRSIDTGESTVGATTWGESALAHVQAMARSERGRVFIDRDGKIVFQSRHSNPNAAPKCTLSDDPSPSDPDGDAGPTIRYQRLVQASESELFWNRANVTDSGDTVYTAADQDSKDDVGVWRTLTVNTENDSAAEAQAFADDIVARHANSARSVFSEVTVNVRKVQADSATDLAVILGLEIGDRVKVVRTPPGASEVSGTYTIEGIVGEASLEDVLLTFLLSDDVDRVVFVLDSPVFGVLDTGPGRLAV